MKEKHMQTLGWVATAMSVMVYVSYIPQIVGNMNGHKGDFLAVVNCTLWVIYGLCKEERDLPLAAVNLPGVVFGLIAATTALM